MSAGKFELNPGVHTGHANISRCIISGTLKDYDSKYFKTTGKE